MTRVMPDAGKPDGSIEANFRQIWLLDRRLSAAARITLASTIVVAGLFGISAYYFGGTTRVPWMPIAIVVFFVLPAMAAVFFVDTPQLCARIAY